MFPGFVSSYLKLQLIEMQNCNFFFVLPYQAGDKSLATVVAHEIAHSWTGNLVTNANYEHFWLNEGE